MHRAAFRNRNLTLVSGRFRFHVWPRERKCKCYARGLAQEMSLHQHHTTYNRWRCNRKASSTTTARKQSEHILAWNFGLRQPHTSSNVRRVAMRVLLRWNPAPAPRTYHNPLQRIACKCGVRPTDVRACTTILRQLLASARSMHAGSVHRARPHQRTSNVQQNTHKREQRHSCQMSACKTDNHTTFR